MPLEGREVDRVLGSIGFTWFLSTCSIHNTSKLGCKDIIHQASGKFYINPYYFSQLFKKKTGMTYQKYLTDYRVDRAKKLLAETELHIYEVCKAVGYSDVNHFNQTFERVEGMKPSEYRQKYKQEEN